MLGVWCRLRVQFYLKWRRSLLQWDRPSTLSVVQFKRPVLPKLEAFPSALTYRYGLQCGRLSIVQFKRPELEAFLSAMGKA